MLLLLLILICVLSREINYYELRSNCRNEFISPSTIELVPSVDEVIKRGKKILHDYCGKNYTVNMDNLRTHYRYDGGSLMFNLLEGRARIEPMEGKGVIHDRWFFVNKSDLASNECIHHTFFNPFKYQTQMLVYHELTYCEMNGSKCEKYDVITDYYTTTIANIKL